MAEKLPRPVVKLTPEMKRRLEDSKKDEAGLERAIGVLKELGLDVKEIEDKHIWAKKARDILLKEFA